MFDSPPQGANTYRPFKVVDSAVTAKIQQELAHIKEEETRELRAFDLKLLSLCLTHLDRR